MLPDILTGSLNIPFASLDILSRENITGFGLSGNVPDPDFEYPIANIARSSKPIVPSGVGLPK